jgi:hypothetical protein
MSITEPAVTTTDKSPAIRPRKSRAAGASSDLFDIATRQIELIEAHGKSLSDMHDIIKNFQDNGITVQTPEGTITIRQAPPVKVEEPKTAEELAADTYLVRTVFMDFIEIHAALAKSFRDRRPLVGSGVQARYNDNAEPTLMIMRKGEYGTNDQMYNTVLTLKIHDDEPFIDGDYMDFGRTVSMSEDQVKRCVSTILTAIRQEESAKESG